MRVFINPKAAFKKCLSVLLYLGSSSPALDCLDLPHLLRNNV